MFIIVGEGNFIMIIGMIYLKNMVGRMYVVNWGDENMLLCWRFISVVVGEVKGDEVMYSRF